MSLESGSYCWQIDNETLMEKILRAKNGEKFKSDFFEIGKLEWRIIICPNGLTATNKNRFCVYLQLVTMSNQWKYIMLCHNAYCTQTMNGCTAIVQYERNGQSKGASNGIYLLSQLKRDAPTSLTIQISLTILKIVLKNDYILFKHDQQFRSYYNNKQTIEWRIDSTVFDKIKHAYPGQPFEDKQNGNWRLVCYPNGNTDKYQGHTGVYLTLCGLPKNVLKVSVKYTFKLVETNTILSDSHDFSYNDSSVGIAKFIQFEELTECEQLEFIAEIEILKQYDYDGNEISEIDHVWNQYIFYQKGYKNNANAEEKQYHQSEENAQGFATFCFNDIEQQFAEYKMRMNAFETQMKGLKNDIEKGNENINNKLSDLPLEFNTNQELVIEFERQQHLYNKRFDLFSSNVDHNNGLMRKLNDDHNKMKQQIKDVVQSINDLKWAIIEEQRVDGDHNSNDMVRSDRSRRNVDEIKENSLDGLDDWNKIKLWMKNDLQLPMYLDLFMENGLDGYDSIKKLTALDLKDIGINSYAHRRKIMKFVDKMNKGQYTI
eukprot:309654_1